MSCRGLLARLHKAQPGVLLCQLAEHRVQIYARLAPRRAKVEDARARGDRHGRLRLVCWHQDTAGAGHVLWLAGGGKRTRIYLPVDFYAWVNYSLLRLGSNLPNTDEI